MDLTLNSIFDYRKVQPETLVIYPNYDYLADIQDSLLEMDGKAIDNSVRKITKS